MKYPVPVHRLITVLIHNSGHFGPPLPFWDPAPRHCRGCRWLVTPPDMTNIFSRQCSVRISRLFTPDQNAIGDFPGENPPNILFYARINGTRFVPPNKSVFSLLRQLTTWHCSRLLLNAALLGARRPRTVDRHLLPGGHPAANPPHAVDIDGTDGRTPCRYTDPATYCVNGPFPPIWTSIVLLTEGRFSCTTHTHPFNGPFSGTTQVGRYQKGKTNLDFTEQETVSGSGICWAICKSAPRCRLVAWHSGRTSVSGRRTFPILRLTCS